MLALIVPRVAGAAIPEADDADEDSDFSFSAMFIGFREALEACVIISVMLNMLDKTDNRHLKKWVWIGSFSGLFVSCVVGGAIVGAYYALKDNVMSDDDMYIFEGVFSGVASIFLTFLGIGFLRFADLEKKWSQKLFKKEGQQVVEPKTIKEKLKAKYGIQSQAIDERALVTGARFGAGEVEAASSTSGDTPGSSSDGVTAEVNYWTIVVLTFSAVFREGLETFLFLGAVGSNAKPSGLALGGLVGIVLGILFGLMVLYIGRMISNMMWFFVLTTLFILFIAAGLAGYSAHEFEEVGKNHAYETNDPIIMRPLWDISECCTDSDGAGAVFRAIAGYQDKPTLIEALVYLGYWILVITLMVFRYKNGVLFSKRRSAPPASSTPDSNETEDVKDLKSRAIEADVKGSVVYPTLPPQGQPFTGMPQYGAGAMQAGMANNGMMSTGGMPMYPMMGMDPSLLMGGYPMQPMDPGMMGMPQQFPGGPQPFPGMFPSSLITGRA